MEPSFGKRWFSITKAEAVIRSILGTARPDIRPLVHAVDITIDLLFTQGIPMDDIHVTDDIYPAAARLVKGRRGNPASPGAVARRIERLANLCWDTLVERGLVPEYIGAPLRDIRAPRDMIFYLAFYVYFDAPFFTVIQKQPALLF